MKTQNELPKHRIEINFDSGTYFVDEVKEKEDGALEVRCLNHAGMEETGYKTFAGAFLAAGVQSRRLGLDVFYCGEKLGYLWNSKNETV